MLGLSWMLSAVAHRWLQCRMPSNRAVRALRAARTWGRALAATWALALGYGLAAWTLTVFLAAGGPGWLNLLIVVSLWNGMKFAALGLVMPVERVLLEVKSWGRR